MNLALRFIMKKITQSAVLCIFFVCLTYNSFAQEAFKVMAAQNVSFVDSLKNTRTVYAGHKLRKSDKVIVKKNSYVALMHRGGKTVELYNVGVYKLDSLYQVYATKKSPGSILYFPDVNESKNSLSYAVETGPHFHGDEIEVFAPFKSYVSQDYILIN